VSEPSGPQSPPSSGATGGELVTVRLLGLPVELHARAAEHGEELQREFVLIADRLQHATGPADMPRRLLALISSLQGRYGGFGVEQEDLLDKAIRSGRPALDLVFRVPSEVAEGAAALGAMLDEADEYCREGRHLLTLATPPDLVAYRRWYLQEFIDQIAGQPPKPWPDVAGAGAHTEPGSEASSTRLG
jgi:hypothetical protein